MTKFYLCLLILLPLFGWANTDSSVGDLPQGELMPGRYIGWVKIDNSSRKIALIAEFFFESSGNLKDFPRLNASFKLSLGGYNTHEYITETFEDLKYDFDNGNLTFDEPVNDFLLTTKVYKEKGRAKVLGQLFIRSSSIRGTVELLRESDEPEDEEPAHASSIVVTDDVSQFIPLLDGQYQGLCGDKKAVLQIQTVRGLQSEDFAQASGLEQEYGISGRLAFKSDRHCGKLPDGKWCTKLHFSSGSYNIYRGKLNLESEQGSQQCDVNGDELLCRIPVFDKVLNCSLKKSAKVNPGARFFKRRFHLTPTQGQIEDLPSPNPPLNEELASALKGMFFGYVHNESNDTYFPIRLDVVPYSATDNPHNPNQMMISSNASIYLGGFDSKSIATQRYEARSLYLEPGFTLSSPNADSFLSITEWKKGFIRGTWYSHGFGRVGTIQLIKGPPMKNPDYAKLAQDFAGEFTHVVESGGFSQWIRFLFPVQPNDSLSNTVQMSGSFRTVVATTGIREIERGVYDLYTGRLGWLFSRENVSAFGSGEIDEDGSAMIFMPPQPMAGAVTRRYLFERFDRVK